jgi:alpha-glucosidase (family GH31 glycosyl hydrolase)
MSELVVLYRVTGGVLDFYIFLGPTPEDVIRQFQEVSHPPNPG